MARSLKSEGVVGSMSWNSILIICKIPICKNDPVPEFGKMWLPLWDEILYSSSSKFQYTRMTLTLKLKKCGCHNEMKFYIHHLQNFRYIMSLSLKSEKCGCLPLWDGILYSLFAKFPYTRMALSLKSEKCGCLNEMTFYMHHLQNFGIQEWP